VTDPPPRSAGRERSAHVLVEPLAAAHDRAAFRCGVEALDRYLRAQATQDVAKRVAAAFVLTEPPAPPVLGFYTLAAASVLLRDLPTATAKRLPKYPYVPATLLGRLAVDQRTRGRGYGELLLLDALARSLAASATIGAAAVLVDAKDDAARRFYERYGFERLSEQPQRLFLPMRTVAALGLGPS
jgi:ribosomal protein S18 acetylase RimI-like enzyme